MQDFTDNHAETALEDIQAPEAGPSVDARCASCSVAFKDASAWRCCDCTIPPTMCDSCFKKTHVNNPFHYVRVWNRERRFWERRSLTELGVVVELGHEGRHCPLANSPPRPMVIVHDGGVHRVRVGFCGCSDGSTNDVKSDATQLLENNFWPATWEHPQTACTLQVLKTFTILASRAHVNAQDFFESLRQKTDGIAPQDVAVSLITFFIYPAHPKRVGPLP